MDRLDIATGAEFEAYARRHLSTAWGVDLRPGRVLVGGKVEKSFDLVGADGRIVGDAKWYKNLRTPAAKWSTIAEYVWLLQRVDAERAFLVFGQDAAVPERFLDRFRALVDPVEFYFLDASGHRRL